MRQKTWEGKVRELGEPDALKGARPVREGLAGNVPKGNAPASYFIVKAPVERM